MNLPVSVFVQALYTVLPALIYGLSGYMAATPQEKFDPWLFTKTLIIGIVVGVVQFEYGVTYDNAFALVSQNAIATYFIDKFVNAIRTLVSNLQTSYNAITPAQQLAIQKAVQIAFNTMFPEKPAQG